MTSIIGLYMLYSWIHTVVVMFRKTHGLTQYEKVNAWVSLVTMFLFVVGALSE